MAGELVLQDPVGPMPATDVASSAFANLKGRQKAAVLLIALGAQNAAEVLKHLSDREVEALSLEMTALDAVDPQLGTLVLDELAERVIAADAMGQGEIGRAHV